MKGPKSVIFLYFLVPLSTSNVAVSVHILRNPFRRVGVRGGQVHDYLDYAIYACSLMSCCELIIGLIK